MNKNILRIMIVAFSLVNVQVFADTHTGKQGECPEAKKFKEVIQSLNLSSEQQAKVKAIKEKTKESMESNRQQLKAMRSQVNQLVQSDELDQSKLDSLINQKKELLGKMMKDKIMAKHEIYTILTPEQKTQFQQKMQQMENEPSTSQE